MNKIIAIGILIGLIFLVGCKDNQPISKCEEMNLTQDNKYVLQDGWIRCCGDWINGSNGFIKQSCDNYKIEEELEPYNESDTIFADNQSTGLYLATENFTDKPLLMIGAPINIPDYSETAYIHISPEKGKKLIYLECVNSSLKMNKTMLYCE